MDEGAAAALSVDATEGRAHGEDHTPQKYTKALETPHVPEFGAPVEAPHSEHRQQQPGKHPLIQDNGTDAEGGVIAKLTQCQTEKKDGQNVSQEASTGEITKRQTFECSHCGKSYGMIGHFLNHQRKHIKAPKSLSQDLEDLKKKAFQCEFCGRNYSRASALEAHLRCHEEKLIKPRNRDLEESPVVEETVIECKPGKTRTLGHLDKPFTCACGKAFAAQMGLKTHQRFSRKSECSPEETAEKTKKSAGEFSCSECKKTFTSNIAFLNHQRWHANRSKNPSKRMACEECGKVFMTPTFYHRHQRLAHSSETPAKSFLHQVCQLQKKAFECKECGLKFSRASALHSHELHHTDIFEEAKAALPRGVLTNQQRGLEKALKTTEQEAAPPSTASEKMDADDTDEEECYGPGDFNVQVISASESEDEPAQPAKPDLELLCESDREAHDDIPNGTGVSKAQMDLKIVQIDLNPAEAEDASVTKETEVKKAEGIFDCPECSLWFSSAASLRIHRMWHAVRKRRQQTQAQEMIHTCKECGLKFTCPELFNTHLHQHAIEEEVEVEEEEAQAGGDTRPDLRMSDGDSDEDDASDEENGATDTGDDTADSWEVSAQKGVASWEAAGPASATATANLRNAYSCLACGKVYTYLVPFLKHQLEHKLHSELRRCERTSSSQRYSCSLCGMMFTRKVQLRAHMRIHGPGPVTPQCDQCGKTFASPRTWAAHMELHKQHLFWCLSCSKGFPDEAALDRHLQGHNRKQHTCNICRQSFTKVTELVAHYQGHTTAEAYQCSLCAKSFMFLGNFISHQKQHGRKTEHSSEIRSGQRTGEFSLSRKEKQRIHEPEAAGVGEVKTEESDCGELSYPLKPSNPPVKSEVAPTSAEEVQEKEAGGAHLHGELQYWQWDCCVCDMGFDEVGKLHLHYVKHATGELPIPQEYV